MNSPVLLLADEPTGSLDRAAAGELGDLLADLNREEGTALVVVTHNSALASRLGRAVTLVAGRLEAVPLRGPGLNLASDKGKSS